MKLSIRAKPFISTKPGGTIVSWNVLSDGLTEAISNSLSNNNDTALFSSNFLKKRIQHVQDVLQDMIQKLKHPIFCLQEVNDAKDISRSMSHILTRFLQDNHYIVLTSTFGTFDVVYPELGLLTAIPQYQYDVRSFRIQQLSELSPNTMIHVKLRPKASPETFHIINTHFPARFNDEIFMRQVTDAFMQGIVSLGISQRLVICGDFNTTTSNVWYAPLKNGMFALPDMDNVMTHLSIQRRDRRASHNTVFQESLDHVFWTGKDITVSLLTSLPLRLSKNDLKTLENPARANQHVIPSVANPSDHFPLQLSFKLL